MPIQHGSIIHGVGKCIQQGSIIHSEECPIFRRVILSNAKDPNPAQISRAAPSFSTSNRFCLAFNL
jgi:hypothetical protein